MKTKLKKIEAIIRQEMDSTGAQELLLPALQPLELWHKSGRDDLMGEVMIRFNDRRGRQICLGPTHEEVITELVRESVSSYKQLPLILYQIQTKFRDELRPRFGVVRSCEFIMKDAYSFDRDQAGLDKNYQAMFEAYKRILTRCGLRFLSIQADPGVMGGSESAEFMVPGESGEDVVWYCKNCGFAKGLTEEGLSSKQIPCPSCKGKMEPLNTIEVGHVFKLGTKYSQALGGRFLDEHGNLQPMVMGCYGIGVSRLVAAVIEQNNDKEGIIWPKEISPYKAVITVLDVTDKENLDAANSLYESLKKERVEVLLDDRDERAGVKFKDADLIGIYLQIIVGKASGAKGGLELRLRSSKEKIFVKKEEALKKIKELLVV